jgi:hypothetical protein
LNTGIRVLPLKIGNSGKDENKKGDNGKKPEFRYEFSQNDIFNLHIFHTIEFAN